MISYKKEDDKFAEVFWAYHFHAMKNIGLNVCYDTRDKSIKVDGNIPTRVSHRVDVEDLERFAKNILELVERVKSGEIWEGKT